MVRMLGFTEDDRNKVARAAAGHGRVTAGAGGGVLGLSSRLVGGLFGATAGGGGGSEGGSGAVGSPSSGFASLSDDHTVGCVCATMLVEICLLVRNWWGIQ